MQYGDPKVLLVDDDRTTRELMRQVLSEDRSRYETTCAAGAAEAIGLLERARFHLVVAEIHMPGISGLDLLANIRAHWPHIKMILMTADPAPMLREATQQRAGLRFFRKPILMEELRRLVASEIGHPDDAANSAARLTKLRLRHFIQICCTAGASTVIQVRKKAATGAIFIQNGEIRHARCGCLTGVDAFYDIFSYESGRFETLGKTPPFDATIDHPWEHLLKEGLHRRSKARDEQPTLQCDIGDATDLPESFCNESDGGAVAGERRSTILPVDPESLLPDEAAVNDECRVAAAASCRDCVRLLVVDDSPLMRHILTNIFSAAPHIQVVGEAENGAAALSMIPEIDPDVVTLDINMPVMDGLTALKHIMIRHPLPTIMCSTLTREGQKVTFDTLKFGAVDFIHKPSSRLASNLEAQYQAIIDKVTLASAVDMDAVRFLKRKKNGAAPGSAVRPESLAHVCAVGASEGGYGALLKFVPFLRRDLPAAFLLIIHDAPANVLAFTRYLNRESAIRVQRAVDGAPIKPGVCYVAAGTDYMTVLPREASGYQIHLHTAPFPGRRGGINMLMLSLAEAMPRRAAGLILSGGGDDGAEGLGEIQRRQGMAMVQAPAACLYKEMPRAALEKTPQAEVLPDHHLAGEINRRWG